MIASIHLLKLGGFIAPGFFIYLTVILLTVVFGLVRYKTLPVPYKWLTQLLLLVFLSELTGDLLLSRLGTNYPFYHALQVIQIIYYGLIFYHLLKLHIIAQRFVFSAAIILLITCVTISLFYQGIHTFPSIGSSLLNLYMVVASLLLFWKMLQSPVNIPLLQQPAFWFGTGSLFFHTITFFVFGYFKLLKDQGTAVPEWGYSLIQASNYLLYGCYFLCLYYAAKIKGNNGSG